MALVGAGGIGLEKSRRGSKWGGRENGSCSTRLNTLNRDLDSKYIRIGGRSVLDFVYVESVRRSAFLGYSLSTTRLTTEGFLDQRTI